MLANVAEYADNIERGRKWSAFSYKTTAPSAIGAGRWGDLSMGAGQPKFNAYVGSQATATPLIGAGNDGIFLGPTPDTGSRFLHSMLIESPSATLPVAEFVLLDYLLHYPLIDGDDTAEQTLDNTLALTRYQDGRGVRVMAVCTTPMTANATITMSYTNDLGVSGRIVTFGLIFGTVAGTIVVAADQSLAAGSITPFAPMVNSDLGIRSIESVTLNNPTGGFFALVLVRPLASARIREARTAYEIVQFNERGALPKIEQGAFLNYIYNSSQNGTPAPFMSQLEIAWG